MVHLRHVAAVALVAASVATAGVVGASAATKADAPTKNIVETAVGAGNFKTLVSLLQATGLDAALSGKGPFTVFAPTDDAFAKVPASTLTALAANPDLLKSVLLYHVVAGSVPASVAATLTSATTLNGSDIGISVVGGSVYINNAKVTTADVFATNGVIHVIDTVLIPPGPVEIGASHVGYCAVPGNTTPTGEPIRAGKFLELVFGQPSWDYHYAGAAPAIFVKDVGITCGSPPAGYTLKGKAPDTLNVPGGFYDYYAA
jgi:uncharacterized surface protein with fasciclin (FAS1) repeats